MAHIPTQHTLIPLFEGFCRKNQMDGKEIEAKISGHPVRLKLATNKDTQMKGMMGSDEPGDSDGMMFVYENEMILSFWMKNISYPLDILFFDAQMNLVNHKTMDPGNDIPDDRLPRYSSEKPAMFAVELRSGWSDNIKEDCKLEF